MPCATSMRKPSTPRSSQKRSVFSKSSRISGLSEFRSAVRCRKGAGTTGPGCRPVRALGSRPARRTPTPSCSAAATRRAPPVAKEIAIPRRATREVSQRGLKPWVRRTGVVGHHVHGDFDALPVCRSDQPFERRHPAEEWVDVAGIGDAVSVSAIGETVTGLIQIASTPSCCRWSSRLANPSRSPTPSPLRRRTIGIDLVEHGSRPPRLAHRIWLRSTSAGARRAGAHWIRSLVLVHQNGELTSE